MNFYSIFFLFWTGLFTLHFLIGYYLFSGIFKRKKGITINISLFLWVSLSLFFISEISIRIKDLVFHGTPFFHSVSLYSDTELGWKGKQIFGDFKAKKFKIFIVGDSFTDGLGVNEDSMYYRALQSKDVELFVYGGAGYGTLQEFLVINRYIDQIKPDLIILQVCSNDFINNQWEMESRSYLNNNGQIRPYWINGRIQYKFPRLFGRTRVFLSTYSRLGYRFFSGLEVMYFYLVKMGLLQSIESEIEEKALHLPTFQKAVQVTGLLIKKMKDRIDQTPLIAFPVNDAEPYFRQFKRIFQENNIPFVAQIPEIISLKEAESGPMRLKDGSHWDEKGQALCGQILLEFLLPLLNERMKDGRNL